MDKEYNIHIFEYTAFFVKCVLRNKVTRIRRMIWINDLRYTVEVFDN